MFLTSHINGRRSATPATLIQANVGTDRNGQSAQDQLSARGYMIVGAYTCQPEGCQDKTLSLMISNDSKAEILKKSYELCLERTVRAGSQMRVFENLSRNTSH